MKSLSDSVCALAAVENGRKLLFCFLSYFACFNSRWFFLFVKSPPSLTRVYYSFTVCRCVAWRGNAGCATIPRHFRGRFVEMEMPVHAFLQSSLSKQVLIQWYPKHNLSLRVSMISWNHRFCLYECKDVIRTCGTLYVSCESFVFSDMKAPPLLALSVVWQADWLVNGALNLVWHILLKCLSWWHVYLIPVLMARLAISACPDGTYYKSLSWWHVLLKCLSW